MRVIHKVPFNQSTDEICEKIELPRIEERMDSLYLYYLSKCIHNDNELIREVFEELKSSKVRPAQNKMKIIRI